MAPGSNSSALVTSSSTVLQSISKALHNLTREERHLTFGKNSSTLVKNLVEPGPIQIRKKAKLLMTFIFILLTCSIIYRESNYPDLHLEMENIAV